MNKIINFFKNVSTKNKIIFSGIGLTTLTLVATSITVPIVISNKKSSDSKELISNFIKTINNKNTFNTFLLNKRDENIAYIKNDFKSNESKILEWLKLNVENIPIKNEVANNNDKNRTFQNEYINLKNNLKNVNVKFRDEIIPLFTRAYEKNVYKADTENVSFWIPIDGNDINEPTIFYKYFFVSNISNIEIDINVDFFKNYNPEHINVFANFDDESYLYNELTDLTIEQEFTYNFKKGKTNIKSLFDNSLETGFSGFIKNLYDEFVMYKAFNNKLLNYNLKKMNKENLISLWNDYSIMSRNESINLFKNEKINFSINSRYFLNEFTSFLRNNIDLENLFDKNGNIFNLRISKNNFYNEISKKVNSYFELPNNNFRELILDKNQDKSNISLRNINLANNYGNISSYNFDFYFGSSFKYSNIEEINILSNLKTDNEKYYINIKQKILSKKENFNILDEAKKNISLLITNGSERYLAVLGQFNDSEGTQMNKPIYIDSKLIDSKIFSDSINKIKE